MDSTSGSEFTIIKVDWYPFIHFCFANIKSITLCTMKLVHWVGGFTVSEGDDGVEEIDVEVSERLGGDVL